MTVKHAAALGVPDVDPVGRAIAGAGKRAGIGEGFQEHRSEVVAGLPVAHDLFGGQCQHRRGEVFDPDPGEQEKSGIVEDEGEMPLPLGPGPANEAIPGARA